MSASWSTLIMAAGTMTLVHGCEVSGWALIQTGHGLLVLEPWGQGDTHRQTCDPQSQPLLCVHRCLEGSAWHPCAQAQPCPRWGSTVKGTATWPSVHCPWLGIQSPTQAPAHISSLKFPKVTSVLPLIAAVLRWWRKKGSDYNSKSWDKALRLPKWSSNWKHLRLAPLGLGFSWILRNQILPGAPEHDEIMELWPGRYEEEGLTQTSNPSRREFET